MDWFKTIKWFYDSQLWTKEQVANAVQYGKITAEQYQKITSEEYNEIESTN